jgi:osmotically-inducible protein OsmY
MKKIILILLFGGLCGAIVWHFYQQEESPTIGQRMDNAVDKTRGAAVDAKDAVAAKAEDWKLTPASIREELARTGRVVRSKAKAVGERMDDARIVAVIKGKYVVDSDLSALAISVDCRDGEVKLAGSVASEQHIGRAVTLALQTHGVRNVVSLLVVKN